MGYTTDFEGQFDITPTLKTEHAAYLAAFTRTRRMARDSGLVAVMPDPLRVAVGLPVGEQGAYYVGAAGEHMGQQSTSDITDYNQPPSGQPGLRCQWVPSDDGTLIEWDGGEKFYDYVEWLEYLIDNFLKPWGYTVSGRVHFQGEESADRGVIQVTDNEVAHALDVVTNPLD